MRTNPQETANLVAFTEEILNGKLYFAQYASCNLSLPKRNKNKSTIYWLLAFFWSKNKRWTTKNVTLGSTVPL